MYGDNKLLLGAARPASLPLARPSSPVYAACPELRREPRRDSRNGTESATVFLIATPKLLEIAVSHTKQNTEAISNRYKNGHLHNAIELRATNFKNVGGTPALRKKRPCAHVARVSCPDEGRVRPEAFEFSEGLNDGGAENTIGPKSLTSEEVSYIDAARHVETQNWGRF